MQIFLSLCYRTVVAEVEPSQTLAQLKSALLPKTGASSHDFYFSFEGKALDDRFRIIDFGIRACSTLQLRVRAHGGGGDGGATGAESRDCYLNMYASKKPDKVDPNEARLAKWSRCTMSSETLKPPCAMDLLGNLFNKEALVSALLSKSLPKQLRHIRGLKDIVTIHLCSIPGISPDDERSIMKFQCPISGQEFNGKYKFFALRGCGHVLSARAFKEVHTCNCLVCHVPFSDTDKIVINGTEEEVLALRQRMEDEKARDKKEKKSKIGSNEETDGRQALHVEWSKLENLSERASENGIKRKVWENGTLKEPQGTAKTLDKSDSDPLSKKFKAADHLPANATKEVYASIFTSSSKNKLKETYMCRSLPLGRN